MSLTAWPEQELTPRYNVAPTQRAPVVREQSPGERAGALLRWGLVPGWASDLAVGSRMINARGETIAEKPAFRTAFAKRRCLVPVSGFYEWKPQASGPKQPFWIGRPDRKPFAFAGLWERWAKAGEPVETFCIITTSPNELMAGIHDRMPVIIDEADYGAWLDSGNQDATSLQHLVRPCPAVELEAHPVSRRVNSPQVDDPTLIDAA